ncbi:MAG: hypothetical protein OXN89_11215 [Bryobacterales bacterium]|nr:hypothetical protein [Bryobacterales bacterium]
MATCGRVRKTLAGIAAVRVRYRFFRDLKPVTHAGLDVWQAVYEPDLVAALESLARGKLEFDPLSISNLSSWIRIKAGRDTYDLRYGGDRTTAQAEQALDAQERHVIRIGEVHSCLRKSMLVGSDSYQGPRIWRKRLSRRESAALWDRMQELLGQCALHRGRATESIYAPRSNPP